MIKVIDEGNDVMWMGHRHFSKDLTKFSVSRRAKTVNEWDGRNARDFERRMEGEKSARGMFEIIDRCKRGRDLGKSNPYVVDQSSLAKALDSVSHPSSLLVRQMNFLCTQFFGKQCARNMCAINTGPF